MTWPSSDASGSNTTSGTTAGQPAAFRADVADLITKFNQMRNHVTSFMQTLLNRSTAALARTDLELGAYYFGMDSSATRTTTGDFVTFTDTSGQSAGGGNSGSAGTYTAQKTGLHVITITCYSSGTFSGTAPGSALFYPQINGTAAGVGATAHYPVTSQANDQYVSFSMVRKLTAGDVVKVSVIMAATGVTVGCSRFNGVFVG